MEDRKEFELKGTVRIATYPFRHGFDTRIMLYNELGEQFVLCVDEKDVDAVIKELETISSVPDNNFYYNDYTEDELISTNGIKITLTNDDKFECDWGGAIDINIIGSEKSYNWRISNDHNGYYGHVVEMIHDGEYIWTEWL